MNTSFVTRVINNVGVNDYYLVEQPVPNGSNDIVAYDLALLR